jgi:bifunctional UDP-N-acetylglucosamine pyrophosphorylase / glucosamine-1-phosphate N-acetyltransferase
MSKIHQLIEAGVKIPNPETVFIANDVDLSRISGDNIIIHAGCKIFGPSTLILQGCNLGYEAPVTIEDCQIGPDVTLNGGFFRGAVFLENSSVGSGAHVREGTILEEHASAAHTVGLKQTILFPFVTLGSLINFCDCFMSGGTSRKDHSEVGSSFIHFNYTPHQDKATPTLVGDVPRGVMLNQRPIFLGGHGGIVGPCNLAFGTVTAAGTICRKDELRPNRLIASSVKRDFNVPYMYPGYPNAKKIANANILYIANLLALNQWYDHIRTAFFSSRFPELLYAGLKQKLIMAIDERIRQLKSYCMNSEEPKSGSAGRSISAKLILELKERWAELEHQLQEAKKIRLDAQLSDFFIEIIAKAIDKKGKNYIAVIKGLPEESSESGTRWLQSIIDRIVDDCSNTIPSLK